MEGRVATLEAQVKEIAAQVSRMIENQDRQHKDNQGRLSEIETLLRIKDAERRFAEKIGALIAKVAIGLSSGGAGWFLRDWQGPHHP